MSHCSLAHTKFFTGYSKLRLRMENVDVLRQATNNVVALIISYSIRSRLQIVEMYFVWVVGQHIAKQN